MSHKNSLILCIVGFVCATMLLMSIVAGVTYKSVSNAKVITELVKEGYSPFEAECVLSTSCNYKIRSIEDLKALRKNHEELADDDG